MRLTRLVEERQKGRSLPKTGYRESYVYILRALTCSQGDAIKPMDYVTRSMKFAREHADHVAAMGDEPAHVIRAFVPADRVFEAYNPGEYFYDGPTVTGKIAYRAKP